MNLATLRRRVDALLSRQGQEDGPPSVVICLPENGHGPDTDAGLPLPRAHRTGPALVVVYDPAVGSPTGAELAALVRGAA